MRFRRGLIAILAFIGLYAVTAYIVVPLLWDGVHKFHDDVKKLPGVSQTAQGIEADPINLAVVGTKQQLMGAMVAAKWYPANPLTFDSCLEIAEATVLMRPYDEAPVSSLYYFGRKEDLAFEQPVGDNPRERHHVRFWLSTQKDDGGRDVWMGAATFDQSVGISETTLQFTHHTAPDIDVDRDLILADLKRVDRVQEWNAIADFHHVRTGKNGEGDPWRTDGALYVIVLKM